MLNLNVIIIRKIALGYEIINELIVLSNCLFGDIFRSGRRKQ